MKDYQKYFKDRGLLPRILWVCKQNKCSLADIYQCGDSIKKLDHMDGDLYDHIVAAREEMRQTTRFIRPTPTFAVKTHPED